MPIPAIIMLEPAGPGETVEAAVEPRQVDAPVQDREVDA